jgi:hypothetical protein
MSAQKGDFVVFRNENNFWHYGIVSATTISALRVNVGVLNLTDTPKDIVMVSRASADTSPVVPEAIFIDNNGFPRDAVAYCTTLQAENDTLRASIAETNAVIAQVNRTLIEGMQASAAARQRMLGELNTLAANIAAQAKK